jgi:hypothetical protein
MPELPDPATKRSLDSRLVVVLATALPFAVGLGVAIGIVLFGSSAPAPAPEPQAAEAPAPPAEPEPEPPPKSVVELAEEGDYKALDTLMAKPPEERTIAETLAIARGRSGNKSRALGGFAAEIRKKPELLEQQDPRDRLREFLLNRETTNQAAGVIAELPGSLGPDLFYEVSAKTKAKNDTTQLAEDLLASREIREKASPALLVALDLRRAEECETFKELLPRVHEKGDRRAVSYLVKLANKRGCGPDRRADCYECLRELDKDKTAIDLGKALGAAQKRPAPKI